MSGVNKCILVGRLGNDPEVKFLNGGHAVCNFSLATSENWVDKQGQKQERTEWHRCVAWGKLAEICGQYLSKGSQAYVEGKIQSRQYEAKDGSQRTAFDIVAQTVQFIGSKQQQGGEQGRASSYQQPQAQPLSAPQQAMQSLGYNDGGADDVPF